jgi:hypothetical protein
MASPEERVRAAFSALHFHFIALIPIHFPKKKSPNDFLLGIAAEGWACFDPSGAKLHFSEPWLALKLITRTVNAVKLHWPTRKFEFALRDLSLLKWFPEVLPRILLPFELARLSFCSFVSFAQSPTPLSFLVRLSARCRFLKLDPVKAGISALHPVALYAQPSLALRDDQSPELFQLLVDSLPLLPSLENLVVPPAGANGRYSEMVAFAQEQSRLARLEIHGAHAGKFRDFVTALKSRPGHELCSVSFVESHFGINELNLLSELEIKCLEFHSAIDDKAQEHFIQTCAKMAASLYSLNFDQTKGLNWRSLFAQISGISVLSLVNCGLELGPAMAQLIAFPNLKVLNLSESSCGTFFDKIPASLRTLCINSVNWSDGTISQFLPKLSTRRLHLGIADIRTSPSE